MSNYPYYVKFYSNGVLVSTKKSMDEKRLSSFLKKRLIDLSKENKEIEFSTNISIYTLMEDGICELLNG